MYSLNLKKNNIMNDNIGYFTSFFGMDLYIYKSQLLITFLIKLTELMLKILHKSFCKISLLV